MGAPKVPVSRLPESRSALPENKVGEKAVPCKNILIVEDDESIRNALQRLREFEGFQVRTASYGNRAQAIPSVGFVKKPIEFDLLLSLVGRYCYESGKGHAK